MRFAIRDLLLMTFVIAVGAMLYNSLVYRADVEARVARTRQDLSQLEVQVAVESQLESKWHNQRMQLAKVKSIAATMQEAFPALQSKQAKMEVRDEQTLSIRLQPLLRAPNEEKEFVRFRVYVPMQRSAFLKFGVETKVVSDPLRSKASSSWTESSDFYPSGPFEVRLESGWHDIDWADSKNAAGRWEQCLRLDGTTLVTSVLELDDVSGFGKSRPLAGQQIDYRTTEPFPRLIETSHSQMDKVDELFRIVVWLDDHASGFASFPRETTRTAAPEASP